MPRLVIIPNFPPSQGKVFLVNLLPTIDPRDIEVAIDLLLEVPVSVILILPLKLLVTEQ